MSLLEQDYRPLEIVVSDNASPDDTWSVALDFVERYPDVVRAIRQPSTVPPAVNFREVVHHARGAFFMWAADDDHWEPNFASMLMSHLQEHPQASLVASEARYRSADGSPLPFFPEGAAWYGTAPVATRRRLRRVVRSWYGNLIYGIYRREALAGPAVDDWRFPTELSVLLQVAAKGQVHVLPDVLFHKTVPLGIYSTVARENGARSALAQVPVLPRASDPARCGYAVLAYHLGTVRETLRVLPGLPLGRLDRAAVRAELAGWTARHARVALAPCLRASR
jgi:hypothetical protein